MRVLIIGGMTMIGHQVYHQLYREFPHLKVAFKQSSSEILKTGFFNPNHIIERVDVLNHKALESLLKTVGPDVVINCATGLKEESAHWSDSEIIELNSVLPHFLYRWCRKNNAFLIHFSSDEVFECGDFPYTETSLPNANSLFGRSMALGEIQAPACLTLRASVLGPELGTHFGQYARFADAPQQTVVASRRNFITSISSTFLAQFVGDQIRYGLPLEGLFQVASQPVSEVELIRLMNSQFRWNIKVAPEANTPSNSKVLSNKKLMSRWPETSPFWSDMLYELHRTVLTSMAQSELQLAK